MTSGMSNNTNHGPSGTGVARSGFPGSKGAPSAYAAVDNMSTPRRFKTAFIFFSSTRHKEIKEELTQQGKTEKTTTIAKMVSKEWREMPPEEREFWEEKSRNDKSRYEQEMQVFNEARKSSKRTKKDPDAPKRPMSAFLAYSNKRRAPLKREFPNATNADLSKMLSKTWKEASAEFKLDYIEEEARLRAQYKIDIVAWRKKKSEEMKAVLASSAAQPVHNDLTSTASIDTQAWRGQQQRGQQLPAGSESTAYMTSRGVTGNTYMQHLGNYSPREAPSRALVPSDLLGSLQGGIARMPGQPEAGFFGSNAFSTDQFLNYSSVQPQFAQYSASSAQEGTRMNSLSQSQTFQGQQILNHSLAAQGLNLGQSLHPSLQALVGTSHFGGAQGYSSMQQSSDTSKLSHSGWLSNAGLGGYGHDGSHPKNNGPY